MVALGLDNFRGWRDAGRDGFSFMAVHRILPAK